MGSDFRVHFMRPQRFLLKLNLCRIISPRRVMFGAMFSVRLGVRFYSGRICPDFDFAVSKLKRSLGGSVHNSIWYHLHFQNWRSAKNGRWRSNIITPTYPKSLWNQSPQHPNQIPQGASQRAPQTPNNICLEEMNAFRDPPRVLILERKFPGVLYIYICV